MPIVLIAAGSNLPSSVGSSEATIEASQSSLCANGIRRLGASRITFNAAFPKDSGQPDYANAVFRCGTERPPQEVLEILLEIERSFGRVREGTWAARPLDLDLIAYGDWVSPGYWAAAAEGLGPPKVPPPLIVPHPRMHHRRFVLEPMREVAPSWEHPAIGLDIDTLIANLKD